MNLEIRLTPEDVDAAAARAVADIVGDRGLLVSAKTAARMLNVSPGTWRTLAGARGLKQVSLGRLVRWRHADVVAIAEEA